MLSALIVLKLSYFGKIICEKWKLIFGSWDQEIDSWFTNHEPLIPTLSYLHSLQKPTILTVINSHRENLSLQEFTEINLAASELFHMLT